MRWLKVLLALNGVAFLFYAVSNFVAPWLLDLARIAAHQSQRRAAPIATYLGGLAFASLPRAERLSRIAGLAARLAIDEG